MFRCPQMAVPMLVLLQPLLLILVIPSALTLKLKPMGLIGVSCGDSDRERREIRLRLHLLSS